MKHGVGLCVAIFLLLAWQASAIKFFHRTTPIRDDYKLSNDQLGDGQFSLQVVRATHIKTGQAVAVKAIKVTEENYLRVNREALILRYLAHVGKHEFVVGFVDSYFEPRKFLPSESLKDFDGPREGTIYIVMDLIGGMDLIDYLQRESPLDNVTTIQLGSQIASAHRFFQKTGISHRDLKPDNIRVFRDETGNLKTVIVDFGMAKFFNKKKEWRDTSCGSPHYVPPEVYESALSTMEQRDAFHVGVILYTMHTGGFPWVTTVAPSDSRYLKQIRDQIVNNRVVPIKRKTDDEKHNALATFIESLLTTENFRPDITISGAKLLNALPDSSIQILNREKTEINLLAIQYILEYIRLKELALDERAAVRSIVKSDRQFINPFYDFLAEQLSPSPMLDIAFIKKIKREARDAGKEIPSSLSILKFFIDKMDVSDESKDELINKFVGKISKESKRAFSASFAPIIIDSSTRGEKNNSGSYVVGPANKNDLGKSLTRRMTDSGFRKKSGDWAGLDTLRDLSEDVDDSDKKNTRSSKALRAFSRIWRLTFTDKYRNSAGKKTGDE